MTMPILTPDCLSAIYGIALPLAEHWTPYLNRAMTEYCIAGRARVSAFLAQIGHESGRLRHVREIWGPTPAQTRYEGRRDLGNTQPGDGARFKGRGLIQITGRANYEAVSDALGEDFIAQPEKLELPKWAALSAGWFWDSRQLNKLADVGEFSKITRRINGGNNGSADREFIYRRALNLFN